MKKLGPIFALAAAVLAIGTRSAEAYPPGAPSLGLSPPTVTTGATFTTTFVGCDPAGFPVGGETVNFDVAGTTVSATCAFLACLPACIPIPPQGAVATLIAPIEPGTYTVTATGLASGATASATLTVVGATPTTAADRLPATGSDSAPIARVAAGLAAAGAGIVVVAGTRRRKAAA